MSPVPHIELIAKRQEELQGGKPDYHVYAGDQLVGRIYQHLAGSSDTWLWGVNGVLFDQSIGAVMHGYAKGFDEANAKGSGRRSIAGWCGRGNCRPRI